MGWEQGLLIIVAVIVVVAICLTSKDHREHFYDQINTSVLAGTLVVLGLTCWAILQQVEEMRRAYGPLNDQAAATKASQRAWIAPVAFSLANANDPVDPLKALAVYQNVGREPAKHTLFAAGYGFMDAGAEPAYKWKDLPSWDAKELTPDAVCSIITWKSPSSVAYPSSTYNYTVEIGTTEAPAGGVSRVKPEYIDAVKNKKLIYVVHGCFTYETLGEKNTVVFVCTYTPTRMSPYLSGNLLLAPSEMTGREER